MGRLLSDNERGEIARLIERGLSRNEIARLTGRSAGTVSKVAQDLKLAFDRPAPSSAMQARVADLADRRRALAVLLMADAYRLREQLWQPCVEKKAMTVGEGDGLSRVEIVEIELDEPTFADKQRIMVSIGIALDKVMAIEDHDRPAEADLSDVEAFSDWMLGETK